MAALSKAQFAELCGIATNALAVYVKRKKVIVVNDLIETTHAENLIFLQKCQTKNGTKSISEAAGKVETKGAAKPPENLIPKTEPGQDAESLLYVKDLKSKIKEREEKILKLELDNQQKMGKVIPTDLVKSIFTQHNQSIITEFKNVGEDLVRVMCKRKDMSGAEQAEIKGELTAAINRAVQKAVAASDKNLISVTV